MGNGPGGMSEYQQLFDSYPRLMGGFVWEWLEHGITVPTPGGGEHFAYGGDFGEEIHDGNFVTDGLVDANRKPRPGLLDCERVVAPLRIQVTEDWSSFTVRNGHDFADTSAFSFQYAVEADGDTYDGGRVEVAPLAAQSEATVPLPSGIDVPDGPAVLTVHAVLAFETAWAPAGHEVAWGESVRGVGPAAEPRASEAALVLADEIRLGTAVFSRLTGMPTHIGGLQVEKLGLSLWWPPTDNDFGREWGGFDQRPLAAQWKDAGLDRLHSRLLSIIAEPSPDGGERLVIRSRLGAADKQFGVLVDYTWTSDGDALALQTKVRPQGAWVNAGFDVEWARIGLEFVLAAETSTVTWFGQGPHQSYPDTGQGTRTGWFTMPLDELDVDYARPQESGARAGVRSASLEIQGSILDVSGEPFALTVRPYSQAVLAAAAHRPDLKPDGRSYVYLDHVMRGVGTAACGPGVLEPYRVKPQDADFTFVLRVREDVSHSIKGV